MFSIFAIFSIFSATFCPMLDPIPARRGLLAYVLIHAAHAHAHAHALLVAAVTHGRALQPSLLAALHLLSRGPGRGIGALVLALSEWKV